LRPAFSDDLTTVYAGDCRRVLPRSSPGGAVLDCCAGSGTTLVAARGLGFDAIGIEGDRSYLPALIRRVCQSVGLQLERAA
jgi:DNA modification methylase